MIGSYLLKLLSRDFYHWITTREGRSFLRLCAQIGHKKRYSPLRITIDGNEWTIPDGFSFLWQYHEIYFLKTYQFATSRDVPVIIDCGSNIGLSIQFFRDFYPSAEIVGFEADPMIKGAVLKVRAQMEGLSMAKIKGRSLRFV